MEGKKKQEKTLVFTCPGGGAQCKSHKRAAKRKQLGFVKKSKGRTQ